MSTSSLNLPATLLLASDLWLWLDERVARLPSNERASMGRAITDAAIALMRSIVTATYTPSRDPACLTSLREANAHLALLRLLVDGAAKRRHLSLSQRDHAFERMGAIGRGLGAWARSLSSKRGSQ